MESMKYLGFLLFFSLQVNAEEKTMQKVVYMKNVYGHIHQNPSRYSSSVSTVHCGYPLTIFANKNGRFFVNEHWYYTEAGPFKGFVHKDHVLAKRGPCFQKKYPRFFDKAGLTLTDYYKLGRLHDLLLTGVSKAP